MGGAGGGGGGLASMFGGGGMGGMGGGDDDDDDGDDDGDEGAGIGDAPPAGGAAGLMAALSSDPSLADLRDDPEVAAIMADARRDPSTISRHLGNPKMTRLMSAAMSHLGGGKR